MGLAAPLHVGSSQTQDWTHVSCIGRWIPYHWATREPPETVLEKKKKKKKTTTFCIATLFPKVTVRNNFKQKFIFSQIWRLENQSQGVNRVVLLLELFMEGPSLPLPVSGVIKNPWHSLVYRCYASISASIITWRVLLCLLFSLYVFSLCLCLNVPFIVSTLVIGLRPTLIQ